MKRYALTLALGLILGTAATASAAPFQQGDYIVCPRGMNYSELPGGFIRVSCSLNVEPRYRDALYPF